ncbi:MAG: hypothetical protein HONBIEJF_00915 [Fimbriimonadaceae bacterium]|nr:hypothetical protein [Fimbriimonadaceae bacterium]
MSYIDKVKISACLALSALGAFGMSQTMTVPGYKVEEVAFGAALTTGFTFVAPNNVLMLEKETGRILRFENGVFKGVVLDVSVASLGEEGLLGIALDPNFSTNGFAYIYYSYALVDDGPFEENRVVRCRYLANQTMVEDQILMTWPKDPNQNESFIHHGGILRFGPDGKLYVALGDMGRGRDNNPRIEQNTGSAAAAGAGGIYRINTDGSIPADNPFISHADPKIKALWVYGVRNCYGMGFDPATGRLWFTDNGPEVYDEVNIGVKGGNYGWLRICGPDARDAEYNDNDFVSYDANQLIYLAGATYQDPPFSMLTPAGITSIVVPKTLKLNSPERDGVLFGDSVYGRLFRLPLNAARDAVLYTPDTQDKVADGDLESDPFLIGNSFGAMTDLQVGPDGYLYVNTFYMAKLFRIRPLHEDCGATTLTVDWGNVLGGGLSSIEFSDDSRLEIAQATVPSNQIPPVRIVLDVPVPGTSTSNLGIGLEARASSASLQQRVELFDNQLSQFVTVDTRQASVADSIVTLNNIPNPARYINAAKVVKMRISYRATAPVFSLPWKVGIDQAIVRFLNP